MPDLAQTNVQLIREMVAAGWSDDDLRRLRTGYELAMWAFSGQFRSNGKTQIAHHVGTASALLRTGARPALVTAAMVHSLYFLGEFGTGRLGPQPEKRARVRTALGPEIEELVDAYTELEWSAAAVRRMTTEAGSATPLRRDVIAMRVANEIDERADFGMRLSQDHHSHDLIGDGEVDAIVALVEVSGGASLGALLREVHAWGTGEALPEVLVSAVDNTVFVPPASYRRRLLVVVQDSRIGHGVAEKVPGARSAATWVRRKLA